jgi:Spy/CpxP family protein refolding chaperone
MASAASACNAKVAGTLAVVFLAGAAVGALTMQMGLHERLHRTVSAATLPVIPKAPNNDAMIQRFKTQLNLSADQTDKIAMVLADYREYYQSLEDQLDDVRSTGKSRIMQILDEQQRAKFEKIMGDLQPQLEAK